MLVLLWLSLCIKHNVIPAGIVMNYLLFSRIVIIQFNLEIRDGILVPNALWFRQKLPIICTYNNHNFKKEKVTHNVTMFIQVM